MTMDRETVEQAHRDFRQIIGFEDPMHAIQFASQLSDERRKNLEIYVKVEQMRTRSHISYGIAVAVVAVSAIALYYMTR